MMGQEIYCMATILVLEEGSIADTVHSTLSTQLALFQPHTQLRSHTTV